MPGDSAFLDRVAGAVSPAEYVRRSAVRRPRMTSHVAADLLGWSVWMVDLDSRLDPREDHTVSTEAVARMMREGR